MSNSFKIMITALRHRYGYIDADIDNYSLWSRMRMMNEIYVAVTVGNGTGARVPTVITFLFWQISMICFLQHIKTMTKIYSSKNYWIWLKNKKVMAKFVLSATGQLADMRKSTQFSNCSYVLSLRGKWIFLSRECCQYCWESI